MANRIYNQKKRDDAIQRMAAAIRECDATGEKTRNALAAALGMKGDSIRRWMKLNVSSLPPDLAALEWVQVLAGPYVPPPKAAPKLKPKIRHRLVASKGATVKRGAEAQLAVYKGRPPVAVTLRPLSVNIEGADFTGRSIPPAFKITDDYIYCSLQDAAAITANPTREAVCEAVHRKLAARGVARDRITKIWDAKFGIAWAL